MPGQSSSDRWAPGGVFPELTPLQVVDDRDVEELTRSARADLAKLSLEVRSLQHEVSVARLAAPADAEPTLDLGAAEALFRKGVEAQVARRRVERRAELERAQRDAQQRIADAEAEAAAIVEAAQRELLAVLTDTESLALPTRQLRGRPAPPIRTASDEEQPVVSRWDGDTADHAERRRMTAVVRRAVAPSPPPARAAAPTLARPELESVPPAGAPALDPPLLAPAPRHHAGGAARRSGWQGLLHIDVLLPLIAVLLVVILLLAWVA